MTSINSQVFRVFLWYRPVEEEEVVTEVLPWRSTTKQKKKLKWKKNMHIAWTIKKTKKHCLSLAYIRRPRTNNRTSTPSPPPHLPLKIIEPHSEGSAPSPTMAARQPLPIFFYDLLFQECIPNALWIDAVLWALAFTLHLKCGCLWNGLEWYDGGGGWEVGCVWVGELGGEEGKTEGPVSYFRLSPAAALTWLSSAPSRSFPPEINREMSSIFSLSLFFFQKKREGERPSSSLAFSDCSR